ncbi:MAG: tetratricopeptide repeat protein, partial [Chloroflexi bacterium]|nr:tetratricopeptide repeat protein [Chloroflexota bacterium]
ALQLASQLLERFPHGVFFVNLAPINDRDLVVPTIAQTLGIKESPSQPLIESLKSYLRDRAMLLVLDNFEQVLEAASTVAELLAASPRLKVLTTSREVLHLYDEHIFPVLPLNFPEPKHLLSLERLTQYEAVSLFIQRARTVKPDFQVTHKNALAVAEICRRLDGLPLAIELAAARVRLLTPEAILARLEHRLPLLIGGARNLPVRQQTLRNTIAWSYGLLDDAEKKLFRRLAVFVGGRTLEAIEAVCNAEGDPSPGAVQALETDGLEGIASLVDKSLLWKEEGVAGEPRFVMLETVREYAWEQLVASGESEVMQRRHADYYLMLAQRAAPAMEGQEVVAWLDRLDRDYDDLRRALNWLLAQGKASAAEDAARLLVQLRVFWDGSAHTNEHLGWLKQAARQMGDKLTPLRSQALRRLSIVARKWGDYSASKAWAEQAMATARELGDKKEITDSLNHLATIDLVQGDYSTARARMEETLAVYREVGANTFVASTLNNLGEVARYQGDYESAEGFYRESLSLFRSLQDRTGIIESVGNWGHSLHHLGRFQEAREALLDALVLAHEINAPARAAALLTGLAGVAVSEIETEDKMTTKHPSLKSRASTLEQVARNLGLAAELLAQKGRRLEPLEQAEFDRTAAAARARLGEEAFNRAWEEGQAMNLNQVFELAGGTSQTENEGEGIRLHGQERPAMPEASRSVTALQQLTRREIEVLRLVAQGLTAPQVAERLYLSTRTVENHLRSIYGKLDVSTRAAATRIAVEHGLLND